MSLQGVKVIDLTRIIAGPFCTQLLADLGADVIKVETPSGDPLRAQGEKVNDFSWYYAGYNRNKKSVAINMRDPDGMVVLKRLLATADVLVENFRPGVLDKMGLSLEVLNDLNPNLIVCSISGF
ncbi:MAG: CoA transferase, partial [Pseudomonadota bacterium]